MGKIQDFIENLYNLAHTVKKNSYSPYSNFKVGAALMSKNGKIYTGTNIENSSYGLTICAERVALFKAVSEGEKEFKYIAISADSEIYPCGACLQVLYEFSKDLKIILKRDGKLKIYDIKEFLPFGFKLNP